MIADATLIVLPLQTLRLLHGKTGLRRRLQAIFMASALTTMASIVNASFNLNKLGFALLVAAEMEGRLIPEPGGPSYRTIFRPGSPSLSPISASLLRPSPVTLEDNPRSPQLPEARPTCLLAFKCRCSSSAIQRKVNLRCTELIQNLM
jgi:hypothetical protein